MTSSFVKRSGYNVTSDDDIQKIPDVKTAILLLKSWGLEIKGLRTREQAIQRLLDHWRGTSEEQKTLSNEKINTYVKESTGKLRSKTDKLVAKFHSMVRFYKQLPRNHQNNISDSFSNIEETAQSMIETLTNGESVLVVAGEIASGQTSFINLLLQTDILPVGDAGCTKTYCELKRGAEPKATLHKRNLKTKESVVSMLNLKKAEDKKRLQNFITSSIDSEEVINEKVVIEFPFTFLEHGIYVYDIPDTIDTSIRLDDIFSELRPDVVFLYVLDVSDLQTGKVEEFIKRLSSTSKHNFNHEDVMVLFNKCDIIQEEDLESVKSLAKEKILLSCPELQSKQIAFLSVKAEQKLEESGLHSDDFQQICKDIHGHFIRKTERRLIEYYRWLSQVQKCGLYTLKVSKLLSNKTLEERREMMAQIQLRIEKFETESRLIIGRLHEEINMEIDKIYSGIIDFLKSTDTIASMTIWLEHQCPTPQKKWKYLKSSAETCIADKLRLKLNEWEQSNDIRTKIKKQIINKFGSEVELMEDQMKKIGAVLACGDSAAVANLHRSFKRDSPMALRASPTSSSSPNPKEKNRLSDYVCSIGCYNKEVKDEIKPIFKRYKKENCTDQMFKATNIYMKCLAKNPQLKEMVSKYVKGFSKDINKIAKMIPDLISIDKQLLTTLEEEVIETKETMHVIPENLRRCIVLQGELDLLYVYEMLELDYQMKNIEWDEKKIIGTGTFAVVHPGFLTIDETKVEVAIKVFKDPLQVNNVSELLLENETLRELDHENIIKYYGASLLQKGNVMKLYWVMIMASCLANLKNIYLDKQSAMREENPGKTQGDTLSHENAKKSMVRYATQICSGLQYLHGKKLVHRDLKLENILVTRKKEIKLTDVGLTKSEEDISGTFAGSPVYMAPEVHEQKTIYNRKADIYSLAMILWEMWYGEPVNDELDGQVRGRLSIEVRKGTRPQFKAGNYTKPPDSWINLIEKCWQTNPKFRPKITIIKEFFLNELRQ